MKDKKNKKDLLELIDSFKEEIDFLKGQIVMIGNFKVSIEKEIKESQSLNNHFYKVNQSMSISERRLALAFDVLNVQGEDYKSHISEENKNLSNLVITNEFEKINKQQLKEIEIQINGRV